MSDRLDRRRFLTAAAATVAGAAVVAFDPLNGGWVTAAQAAAAPGGVPRGAVSVPDLDGELTTDPAALAEAADDYGHIVHRTPVAVLRPGSVRDVVRMVRYAKRHCLGISVRGQGHSTDGQSQVRAGVVIDSRTLARIHEVRADRAVVDPGVTWLDLAVAAVARGLTPPVFTDYVGLSIGGTLMAGGIGGTTQTYGMQVDTVLELEVVTGEGDLVRCSPRRHAALFHAVLGSLGQLAIVVRATITLIPAPAAARGYQLYYSDLDTYLGDQRRLLGGRRFSSLEGQAVRDAADTRWDYLVDAAAYHDGTPPDDAAITRGLRFDPARTQVTDYTYLEWVNRLAPTVEFLKQIGAWYLPHPWIDVFLPDSRVRAGGRGDAGRPDAGRHRTGAGAALPVPAPAGPAAVRAGAQAGAGGLAVLAAADHGAAGRRGGAAGGQPGAVRADPRRRRQALPHRLGAADPPRLAGPLRPGLAGLRRGQGGLGPAPHPVPGAGHLPAAALSRPAQGRPGEGVAAVRRPGPVPKHARRVTAR